MVLNCIPKNIAWYLNRRCSARSITTVRDLARWGRPRPGQWKNFGVVKIGILDRLVHAAGLQWEQDAPEYPMGNPLFSVVGVPIRAESAEAVLDDLISEMDCRVANGADSNGHLEALLAIYKRRAGWQV